MEGLLFENGTGRTIVCTQQMYAEKNAVLHSHPFSEFVYYRNDCGAEYLVGTYPYKIQKGDLLYIPAGTSHGLLPSTKMTKPLEVDILWISPELEQWVGKKFSEEALQQRESRYLIRCAGTEWESLGEYFHIAAVESKQKTFCWEEMVEGYAYIILSMICRAFLDENIPSLETVPPTLLEQVLSYIQTNMSKKITLSEIAQQFYTSESSVKRLFQKKLGISFYRYIMQLRLSAAQQQMQSGHSLEEIGRNVGFGDYPTFYRAFRKEFGISPREYQRQYQLQP